MTQICVLHEDYLMYRRRICECFCFKKKTAYFVICPSNQPLCFSPLSQVGGRALLPSLQPNRAPATAPLVSASPPCKMRNTTRLKQTAVAWKFGTQVQVAWESSQLSRHQHWFPCKMTSEKWAQKFHTDDASLPRSGSCFSLVLQRGKFASTNR